MIGYVIFILAKLPSWWILTFVWAELVYWEVVVHQDDLQRPLQVVPLPDQLLCHVLQKTLLNVQALVLFLQVVQLSLMAHHVNADFNERKQHEASGLASRYQGPRAESDSGPPLPLPEEQPKKE